MNFIEIQFNYSTFENLVSKTLVFIKDYKNR